jgi:hypothetical protein
MATVILQSSDKNFIFQFSFSPNSPSPSPPAETNMETASTNNAPITIGTAPLTYLEVVAYRQDYPDLAFNWAGLMKENQTIAMSIPPVSSPPLSSPPTPATSQPDMQEDDNWCKGSFHLYQNSQTGDRFVWFDLNFGPGYEAVYEGCMVQFPSTSNS